MSCLRHNTPIQIAKLIVMINLAFNWNDKSRHSWNMYTFCPAQDMLLRGSRNKAYATSSEDIQCTKHKF